MRLRLASCPPLRAGLAALALVVAGLGCATLGLDGGKALFEQGKAAAERGDPEAAYRHFKQLYLEHPDSEVTQEAYVWAVASLQALYQRNRHDNRTSPWVTTEPDFMYGWMAHELGRGNPEDVAKVLFIGMNWSFFTSFQQYAEKDPALAGWRIEASEDNGIIERVEVQRP